MIYMRSWIYKYLIPAVSATALASQAIAQEEKVVNLVNADIIKLSDASKSYTILFDAALELSPAPSTTGGADEDFNIKTIYSGMDNWSAVRDWAESNPGMAEAILRAHSSKLLGLPYGDDLASQASNGEAYLENGMYADIAVDGNLRVQDFAYLDVMDTITAYAVAEIYRLLEAGNAGRAVDLMISEMYVLDQFCEREFLAEKLHAMRLLIDYFATMRDMMYVHFDVLQRDHFSSREDHKMVNGKKRKGFSFEILWLRMDLLQMPEGDKISAEAIFDTVFDPGGTADPEMFSETYGKLQAADAAFTQFGAVRRWRTIADFHGSKMATIQRLNLVYDDWWRRWSVRAWDQILDIPTQFERTNAVRFAAVTYSLSDLQVAFHVRRLLIASANGTALAAAICGYRKRFDDYPNDLEKVYATFIQKRLDIDPFDKEEKGFGYRELNSSENIVVQGYDDFIEVKGGLLWAKGADFETNRGKEHSDDGLFGDIIYWPPLRALAREQGVDTHGQ